MHTWMSHEALMKDNGRCHTGVSQHLGSATLLSRFPQSQEITEIVFSDTSRKPTQDRMDRLLLC